MLDKFEKTGKPLAHHMITSKSGSSLDRSPGGSLTDTSVPTHGHSPHAHGVYIDHETMKSMNY